MHTADALRQLLPDDLKILADLVMDMRWNWSHGGDEVWRSIDPETWERTRNPYLTLSAAAAAQLERLAADAGFRRKLAQLIVTRRGYRRRETWWAAQRQPALRGIAYFSMEFGLTEALPLYAGGLGVLAGDYLKAASDLGLPVVGIGLLYARGYFRQRLDTEGWQHAVYTYNDPGSLPVEPVLDASGGWLGVLLQLPGRSLRLRVWKAQAGLVTLYLLDSNDPWNAPADRGITGALYGGGQEQRLLQEMVLGIGGWRLIEALQLPIDICHLNEGHAALAAVERARCFQLRNRLSFAEALWATRAGNVFTTHTPVTAGFDRFPRELVLQYGRRYAADAGIDENALLALGREDADGSVFNMAFLAARCCAAINGVSRLHGEVSRQIFAPLYPRWPLAQVPVSHVTNGVHMPSWDSAASDALWTGACGAARWLGETQTHSSAVAGLADETLWALRGSERVELVRYARHRLKRQLGQRGAEPSELAAADCVLDPNALTLGFARRFAEYKRNNLLLSDPPRLARLLLDPHRPLQLVVAGKAHPDDERCKRDIQDWVRFARSPQLRDRVVFLEDYDLTLAEHMVQGVDVWLNTPRRPWEACGTSGMKVLVNGGLNLSVADGWWAEADAADAGWTIEAEEPSDAAEARRLFELLEQEVLPLFYSREADGIPHGWIARIRASLSKLTPRFSTNRMLCEYIERLYLPAALALSARVADGARLGRELQTWETRLRDHWSGVRLGSLSHGGDASMWRFSVDAYLGELLADDIDVQIYADAAAERPQAFCRSMSRMQAIPGTTNGFVYVLELPPQGRIEDYTPRIVPRHDAAWLPQELPLIRWP